MQLGLFLGLALCRGRCEASLRCARAAPTRGGSLGSAVIHGERWCGSGRSFPNKLGGFLDRMQQGPHKLSLRRHGGGDGGGAMDLVALLFAGIVGVFSMVAIWSIFSAVCCRLPPASPLTSMAEGWCWQFLSGAAALSTSWSSNQKGGFSLAQTRLSSSSSSQVVSSPVTVRMAMFCSFTAVAEDLIAFFTFMLGSFL